ncbi:ankyrin repeat-containing domain protein [Pterulicium gracile]|uniref:Ankyrin repeat-containing domain protein n=1 Tax=Pterulicium gracile TaxID=1884261 RepID=A0A5C3Q210_9AGAR|nr:ankyrin repeat-containing domain protein [Pterula gracilis]
MDLALLDSYFSHPFLMWLAVATSEWRVSRAASPAAYLAMVLASGGLESLLERHLHRNPNTDLNHSIDDGQDNHSLDSQMSATVASANFNCTLPLHIAACNRHTDTVLLLMEKGVSINSKAGDGVTALLEATRSGNGDIVAFLLTRGAAVDMADAWGQTPLIVASEDSHIYLTIRILSAKAAVDLQRRDGCTALNLAASKGHFDIVTELLNHNASVDLADQDGWTPLMSASNNGHTDSAVALLRKGASMELQEADGSTAFLLAIQNGHYNTVLAFLEPAIHYFAVCAET